MDHHPPYLHHPSLDAHTARPATPGVQVPPSWRTLVPSPVEMVLAAGLAVVGFAVIVWSAGVSAVAGAVAVGAAVRIAGGGLWQDGTPAWIRRLLLWTGSCVAGVFVVWTVLPAVIDGRRSGLTTAQVESFSWAAATAGQRGAAIVIGGLLGLYGRVSWLMFQPEEHPHVHETFAVHLGGVWTQYGCRSKHNLGPWVLLTMALIIVAVWVAAGFGVIDLSDPPY